MSLHLDYADENFRDAWIASTNDPAAIKALAIGGRALVRSGRELERLSEQMQQLRREVEELRSQDLGRSETSRALEELRDIRIAATAQCERCAGGGAIYDPGEFGWRELLAGDPATLDDRVSARVRARELDNTPPEGQCPECEGSGRHPVTLTVSEYESLRRRGATPLVEPPTLTDLVQNPRRVVELSNRELLEMGGEDPRQLLVRSLRHAYREVRREYAANLRAAQAHHESGERTRSPQVSGRRQIESLLAEGKRIETALVLLLHEQARDGATPGPTAVLVPEL